MKPSDLRRLRAGLKKPKTAATILHMSRILHPSIPAIRRFVDSSIEGEWEPKLRTPLGVFPINMRTNHDVRTVHEIFSRRDYEISADKPLVIVDVGGNIGLSALYFLTQNKGNRVHVWEPDPANLELLRCNLKSFEDRLVIHEAALAPEAGTAQFEVEDCGRYGGLSDYYAHPHLPTRAIEVRCESVAAALSAVIQQEGRIDVMKVDTEGSEQVIVDAIPEGLLKGGAVLLYEEGDHVRRKVFP